MAKKNVDFDKTVYVDPHGRKWSKKTLDSLLVNLYQMSEARDAIAYYFFKR
jgi:hypothetical protein